MRNGTKIITALVLSMAIVSVVVEPVCATTISDLETQIQQNQDALNNLNNQIDDMESAQELLEEEISDLNAEMINLMTSIGLLEDNIAQKEIDIAAAEVEYQNALATELKQYNGKVDSQEIGLPVSSNGLVLPCGASGRWESL